MFKVQETEATVWRSGHFVLRRAALNKLEYEQSGGCTRLTVWNT